jgi:hypothetical protein
MYLYLSVLQKVGCILFHYQCGCCPVKCCDYDNDAMCWGCVCCELQIDPCYIPRQITHLVCMCIPCSCCAEATCLTIFCCNPGKETADPTETHKAVMKANNKK